MTTTPILQFGTSRFLQAHADLFISEAMATGEALGPVTVVKTTADAGRENRLAGLAAPDGFPVEIRGMVEGRVVERDVRVTSIHRALSAAHDWDRIGALMESEIRLVISNTAEAGYNLDPGETTRPAGMSASFPGKLIQLLHRRYQAGGAPLSIIPTELVSRNGEVLSGILSGLADSWYGDRAFRDWLDSSVTITHSLVDRIVSRALEPAGAVAEPYALWAIAARDGLVLPCRHPAIVVAPDISSYERLKLFILNLGHTILVDRWLAHGLAPDMTVRAILGLDSVRSHLLGIYDHEIVPGFARHGMEAEARAYVAATLDRFANPFLDHYLRDIHQHHAEKIRRRAGGFLDWAGTEGRPELLSLVARG